MTERDVSRGERSAHGVPSDLRVNPNELTSALAEKIVGAAFDAEERCGHVDAYANTDICVFCVRAAIAAHTSWQPIETAPKDWTLILVWSAALPTPCIVYWDNEFDKWRDDSWHRDFSEDELPTHWMPIPEPPK